MAGEIAMNQNDADRWKSEALDEILAALAADDEIEECLVFKGARVETVSGTVMSLFWPPVGTKRHHQAGQETVPDTLPRS
jgi:hypothetical protein